MTTFWEQFLEQYFEKTWKTAALSMSGPNKALFDDGSKSVTHVLTDRRPFRCLVLYSNSKLLVSMGGDGLSGPGGRDHSLAEG